MRRSAACSCASPRAAASLAARSAVTAARIIEVSAATATNSCVAIRLSVSESRTNGPEPFEVSQTVSTEAASSAAAAPRGPKRSAAQISAGKITYGTSCCEARVGQDEQNGDQRRALDASDSSSGARARSPT